MDTLFLELIPTFIDTIVDLRKGLVAGNDITSLSQVIIGLAVIIHIASIAYPAILNNRPVDFYAMGRPFVIALIALNINVLLMPIDGLGDAILQEAQRVYDKQLNVPTGKNPSEAFAERSNSKTPAPLLQAYDKVGDSAFGSWERSYSVFMTDPNMEALINKNLSVDEVQKVAEGGVVDTGSSSFLQDILSRVMTDAWEFFNMVYLLMIFLQQFYLAILGIFGSFAIAMSIFPAFSSSSTEWFGRYISVSLWGPIAVIVKSILQRIIAGLMSTDTGGLVPAMLICGVLTILLGFLLFFVPTLAGFCIQASGGMGALQSYVHDKLSSGRHAVLDDVSYKMGEGMHSLKGLREDYKGYRSDGFSVTQSLGQTFQNRYTGVKGTATHLKDFVLNQGIHSKERTRTISQLTQGLMNVGFSSRDASRFANDIIDQYGKDYGNKVGARPDGSGSTTTRFTTEESTVTGSFGVPGTSEATGKIGGRPDGSGSSGSRVVPDDLKTGHQESPSTPAGKVGGRPEDSTEAGKAKATGGPFTFSPRDEVNPRLRKDLRYKNTGSVQNAGPVGNIKNNK